MRKSYPSDISREQFEEIREELAGAKKATHPRKYVLYDIFCAILYLLKEGCTWRAIPHDFPKWQNVRYHYDIWASPVGDVLSNELSQKNILHFSIVYKYLINVFSPKFLLSFPRKLIIDIFPSIRKCIHDCGHIALRDIFRDCIQRGL